MIDTLTLIELSGGADHFEETFKIRAECRQQYLKGPGKRPLSCLEALVEASAAEFLVWLSMQSSAKRDRVLEELAPKLEELAALRWRNQQLAMKLIRKERKMNGNGGHANLS